MPWESCEGKRAGPSNPSNSRWVPPGTLPRCLSWQGCRICTGRKKGSILEECNPVSGLEELASVFLDVSVKLACSVCTADVVRRARITQGLKISNRSCLVDVLQVWELAEVDEAGIPAFC